jgi:uncharacterized lipoprotein
MLKKIGFITLFLCLAACQTYIQDKDKLYLNAKSIPPLNIPPGLSSYEMHNYYPISDRYQNQVINKPSIIPPGLYEK